MASPGARLRRAWAERPIMIPGAFNALAARMAERLGFEAVYLSGGALSAGWAGVPDIGLLTATEFAEQAAVLARDDGPTPAGDFWEAEPEHQDYLQHYPSGYTCHFVRPGWKLPRRAQAGS